MSYKITRLNFSPKYPPRSSIWKTDQRYTHKGGIFYLEYYITFLYILQFLAYTCGIIRGALANLGIASVVIAETATMPSCRFHITIQRPS